MNWSRITVMSAILNLDGLNGPIVVIRMGGWQAWSCAASPAGRGRQTEAGPAGVLCSSSSRAVRAFTNGSAIDLARCVGCPDCGGELLFSGQAEPRVIQQAELVVKPLWITEHRAVAYWFPHCRKVHHALLPAALEKTGLFGPRLTTLVAFMKGVCHASCSTIRKFLRDVLGIKVSRGYLAKVIAKATECLRALNHLRFLYSFRSSQGRRCSASCFSFASSSKSVKGCQSMRLIP